LIEGTVRSDAYLSRAAAHDIVSTRQCALILVHRSDACKENRFELYLDVAAKFYLIRPFDITGTFLQHRPIIGSNIRISEFSLIHLNLRTPRINGFTLNKRSRTVTFATALDFSEHVSVLSTIPSSFLGSYFLIRGIDGVCRTLLNGKENIQQKQTAVASAQVLAFTCNRLL
jgi:hypothetical protein